MATCQGWLARIGLDRIEATVIREAELAVELDDPPEDEDVKFPGAGSSRRTSIPPRNRPPSGPGWKTTRSPGATPWWPTATIPIGSTADQDMAWFAANGLPYPTIQAKAPGSFGDLAAQDQAGDGGRGTGNEAADGGRETGNGKCHRPIRSFLARHSPLATRH